MHVNRSRSMEILRDTIPKAGKTWPPWFSDSMERFELYNSRHCSLFLYRLLTIGYVSVKRSLSNFCISLIRVNKLPKYCFYKFTRQLTIKDRLKRFQLFKTWMERYTVSVFQSVRVFNSLCVNHSPECNFFLWNSLFKLKTPFTRSLD